LNCKLTDSAGLHHQTIALHQFAVRRQILDLAPAGELRGSAQRFHRDLLRFSRSLRSRLILRIVARATTPREIVAKQNEANESTRG